MPRAMVDQLSLEYHLTLEVLHSGCSDGRAAATLVQVLLVAWFLYGAGYRDADPVAFVEMDATLAHRNQHGNETGE